jgi:hypothetical protein
LSLSIGCISKFISKICGIFVYVGRQYKENTIYHLDL